jgi:hypothetical protein
MTKQGSLLVYRSGAGPEFLLTTLQEIETMSDTELGLLVDFRRRWPPLKARR